MKTKSPERGSRWSRPLPTFDAKSKSAKIPNSLYGEGWGEVQLPTFDAESKSAKIPNSLYGGGGGEGALGGLGVEFNVQLLMQSPNLLKSQIPYMVRCRGWGEVQLPTFDAEFKSAIIQKIL